ncbi:MAG: L-seryl-tRNA(Sec) selenium transferase [Proteobacteria bacterium]|nr:L-seryl-tRNA(Sec) selenium transferase [Pseudomonadota bacterium]MBU1717345.1 L-seryl-tRNA(Sec) selenium transferase [Pseudomonadota bacterium]
MTDQGKPEGNHSAAIQNLLRAIPKVDEFLGWLDDTTQGPLVLIKDAVREVLAAKREAILAGHSVKKSDLLRPELLVEFNNLLSRKLSPNFISVINATGVVVHTNLGRSILPAEAMAWLQRVGSRYSNLEFDLATGQRGSRYSLVEKLLCELTGAEAALVVNNNAAAVMLALDTLAKGREVIVSRGQLVEIGGSFRIPDVMEKSGARLVEVGATNRTHLRDYEKAITEQTAMLLKVHTSNFKIIGFTSEVELAQLVALGERHGLPVMEDLGSGSLIDLSKYGLQKEPTVSEVVKAGVDIVTFSGDKLLGGPQAGLIIGKRRIIDQVKRNPMNRALRIDKFTLAGLEAVLRLYFDEEVALHAIPTLAMLTMPPEVIDRRAKRLLGRVKKKLADYCAVSVISVDSRVGGGAMPDQSLPSRAVSLHPFNMTVNDLESGLRKVKVPVIGRIEDDCFLLDMRTVADDEVSLLSSCLLEFFGADV